MDSLPKINQKIKDITKSDTGHRIGYAFFMSLFVFLSFILGRISVFDSKKENLTQDKGQNIQIYLPDGSLYENKVNSKNTAPPLAAYILGALDKTTDIPEPTAKERVEIIGEVSGNLTEAENNTKTDIFASKSGKVYYVPNCKAGNRVKLENRIYFENEDHAQEEGFTKSKQCK